MKINTKKSNLIEIFLLTVLIAGILVCGGFYLFQVNSRAAFTFKLAELEKKVSKLEQEAGDLKIKSAGAQSISVLEAKSKEMGMAQISSTEFIDMNSSVALR